MSTEPTPGPEPAQQPDADVERLKKLVDGLPPMPSGDNIRYAREHAGFQEPPDRLIVTVDTVHGSFSDPIVRFSCPLGCGWHHDEHPALEPIGTIVLPVGFTPADLSAAISTQAVERDKTRIAAVNLAFTAHCGQGHGNVRIVEAAVFLYARLDEDEAYARAAFADEETRSDWTELWSGGLEVGTDVINTNDSRVTRFMERNDPSQTLRRIESQRQQVGLLLYAASWNNRDDAAVTGHEIQTAQMIAYEGLRIMTYSYMEHPAYKADWKWGAPTRPAGQRP